MNTYKLILGKIKTNIFFFYSRNKEAYIIDPPIKSNSITKLLKQTNFKTLTILLTHAHFDHISGVKHLQDQFNCKAYIHSKADLTLELFENHIKKYGEGSEIKPVDLTFINESTVFPFDETTIKVIPLPGHTPCSIGYLINGHLFSGDTIFKGSFGKPSQNYMGTLSIYKSLKRIVKLPKETIIHTGHGEETTVEEEIKNNKYIQPIVKSLNKKTKNQ